MDAKNNNETGRRQFISKLVASILAISGLLIALIGFIIPFPKTGRQSKRHKVGRVEDYPINRFTFSEKEKVFIIRDREGVRAVSAICTHLGCILNYRGNGFECPCHGSKYGDSGEVLSGPAPTALKWFQITKAPDGRMVLHLDQSTESGEKFLKPRNTASPA